MLAQLLHRTAQNALRRHALHVPYLVLPPTALIAHRHYAKYTRPPYIPQDANQSRQANDSRVSSSSQQAAQRGSDLRKQTWNPQNPIRFGSSPSPSGSTPPSDSSSDAQTAEFNRSANPSKNTVPSGQPGPQPRAVDPSNPTPVARTSRSDEATEEFNTKANPAVNTAPRRPPSEQPRNVDPAPDQPETEGPVEPLKPLPDLRQGIPSTFTAEFGLGGRASSDGQASETAVLPAGDAAGSGRRSRRPPDEDAEYSSSDYETSTDRARAKVLRFLYVSLGASLLVGTFYFGRPYEKQERPAPDMSRDTLESWTPGAVWMRIRSRMTGSVQYYTEPTSRTLLPTMPPGQQMPYTLVLSLEDLLVHSEWSLSHGWRTAKRPGVDYFLRYLSQYFELAVFTTVPYAMGEQVLRKLDPYRIIAWPLFREATKYENGTYIKDLAYLNRPLEKVLIIDTKAEHVANQPNNAILLSPWEGDPKDAHAKDLVALIPFLEHIASMNIADVRKVIESFKGKDIPIEFARREALERQRFQSERGTTPSTSTSRGAGLGGFLSSALGVKSQPAMGSIVLSSPADMETGQPQTLGEGLAKGKMSIDQFRERGQREYQRLEAEIQKNGAQWLKDMEEEEKRQQELSVKDMKSGWFSYFSPATGADKSNAANRSE